MNVCNDCDYYDIASCTCQKDGTLKNPLTPACESFELDTLLCCCAKCKYRYDIQKWDYSEGCKHTKLDGYACTALGHENVIIWMTGEDEKSGCCEYFTLKE